MAKPAVAVVGCGRVGTALAVHLSASGYPIAALVSRSLDSARRAAAGCGAPPTAEMPGRIAASADVVFITTPDGTIEAACRELTAQGSIRPGMVVLHCSGALPSSELDAAKGGGAHVGSLHPLQSFAAGSGTENPFRGIIMAAEGDEAAIAVSERIAADLGATCFRIRTEAKTLYHASAVVASNYLVTLLDLSFGLLSAAGIPESKAMAVLKPLINGTLANVEKTGPAPALTGPIARGDAATVERHLADMERLAPERTAAYRALGLGTVKIAEAGGHITREVADQLVGLLREKA